jgi:[histone H3]-lysine4 N-trimethyltransferase ASH1L
MAATQPGSARPTLTRSTSADSVLSTITVEASSNVQLSSSSTPPSSAADSASVSFTSIKLDIANSTETNAGVGLERVPASNSRTWRSRASIFGTYNIKVLSGTAVHAPKKYRNDEEREIGVLTRRRTISGGTSLGSVGNADISSQTVVNKAKKPAHGIETLNSQWTTNGMSRTAGQIAHGIIENLQKGKRLGEGKDTDRRRSSRLSGEKAESFTKKLSVLGKRGRHAFEASLAKAKRELKNLADTNEFAKIDTKPVVSEVWSNGKLVTDDQSPKTRATTGKTTTVPEAKNVEQSVVTTIPTKGREKLWLNKGLYAGQDTRDLDWFRGKASLGKIKYPEYNSNGILPLPMWHGQRILYAGRDFKLPFDVCSPLPPGQPKPDEWRKVPKSEVPLGSVPLIILY